MKFLLNADGGHFVFQKEADSPNWTATAKGAYTGTGQTIANLPGTTADAKVLDVRDIRTAVAIFKPTDDTFVYDFKLYAYESSESIAGWYYLDGSEYVGQQGNLMIGVDCRGVDFLTILVTSSLSSKTIDWELAPIPYDV